MIQYITYEAIKEEFSEFKDYIFWILCSFSLVSLGIQFIYNWKLSQKIESYKNELKKNEIKFSRFNELQIESLKNLYDHIVTFHFRYNNLLYPIFFTHDTLSGNLKVLKLEYNICMEYFHRNKIFLTENLVLKIKDIETNYILVRVFFDQEIASISEIEDRLETKNPQEIYGDPESEVTSIKKRLENLKDKQGVISFEQDIKGMRDLVEKYFKELTT